MFKVQIQMMSGEWQDCGKLSEFIDGVWKTKEFATETAARAAAIAAYPDHYPEHSDNATFRIICCNEENEMLDFIDTCITIAGAAMLAAGYILFTIVAFFVLIGVYHAQNQEFPCWRC